jgi:hypothetical protein
MHNGTRPKSRNTPVYGAVLHVVPMLATPFREYNGDPPPCTSSGILHSLIDRATSKHYHEDKRANMHSQIERGIHSSEYAQKASTEDCFMQTLLTSSRRILDIICMM